MKTSVMMGLATVALLCLPAAARGQESTWFADEARGKTEEGAETNFCSAEGGVIDSVNSAIWEDHYLPCFAAYDDCKTTYVLSVGDARVGKISGSYYSNPDASYESGECGWATPIGRTSGGLYVYVDDAIGVNFNCSSQLWVAVDFSVEEHSTMDCSGVARTTWWDGQDCEVICLDGAGYSNMASAGVGDCNVTPTDERDEGDWSDVCHMPDIYIPSLTYQYSYKYTITTWIYVGGTWQYGTSQSGCFKATAS